MVWPLRYWLKQTAGTIIVYSLALLHPAICLSGPTATAGQAAKLPFPAGEHGLDARGCATSDGCTQQCRYMPGYKRGYMPPRAPDLAVAVASLGWTKYSVASRASGSQVSARAVYLSLKYDKCAPARPELHFPQTPIASVHFASFAHLGIPFYTAGLG